MQSFIWRFITVLSFAFQSITMFEIKLTFNVTLISYILFQEHFRITLKYSQNIHSISCSYFKNNLNSSNCFDMNDM